MQQQASKDKSLLAVLAGEETNGKGKEKKGPLDGIITPDGGSLALAIRTGMLSFFGKF